jgi:hypothetical protein
MVYRSPMVSRCATMPNGDTPDAPRATTSHGADQGKLRSLFPVKEAPRALAPQLPSERAMALKKEACTFPAEDGAGQPSGVELTEEGALLARYLLGGDEPGPEPLERYARACEKLFSGPYEPGDLAVLRLARHHRWTLPLLDAAAGVFEPHALLRKKLLLMLAILETMPAHLEHFTPRAWPARARWRLLAGIGMRAAGCLLQAAAGAALYPLARRAK